jgi:DNA sulfur modification protein DndB
LTYNSFPAVRGIQAGREYFVTAFPLRLVPKLFVVEKSATPPELRGQRALNKSRIPSIRNYIVNNPDNYIFPSMIVSIDSEVDFIPFSKDVNHFNIGTLKIPKTAKLVINDGQHRKVAIEEALKENPVLKNESISVIFFIDWGVKHSQQMFSDLNRFAVRPSKSLSILFDHRDPSSKLTIELVKEIEIFHKYTELEKTELSGISTKFFTLSGIFFSTKELLKGKEKLTYLGKKQLAKDFWSEIFMHIDEWQQVDRNNISPSELRNNYICSHTVALIAMGRTGNALLNEHPNNWKDLLSKLHNIDWRRNNPQWEGRVTIRGKISNSRNNILLLSNVLKKEIGIALNEEEKGAESAFENYE